MENWLYGIIIILVLIISILLNNNYRLVKRVDEFETYLVEVFLNTLILYENYLMVDAKGYFRTDDHVGKEFDMLGSFIREYFERIDELDFNIEDNEEIQKRILNIEYYLGKISELEKEERLYQFNRTKKTTSKSYIKK